MSSVPIDQVDYGILKCVQENDRVWKKRVYELLSSHHDELPQDREVSVQTVGRRINSLQEQGLLESCIISPDDLNRDLIIGYSVTAEGCDVMHRKRDNILREKVLDSGAYLLGSEEQDKISINRVALDELFCDQFHVSEDDRGIVEACNTEELLTILASYYFREHLDQHLERQDTERMKALVNISPTVKRSFDRQTVLDDLITAIRNGVETIEHSLLRNSSTVQHS